MVTYLQLLYCYEFITVINSEVIIKKASKPQGSEEMACNTVCMKSKLKEHFGNKIVITVIKKKANAFTFQRNAVSVINEFYYTLSLDDVEAEKTKFISAAVQLVKSEIILIQILKTFRVLRTV